MILKARPACCSSDFVLANTAGEQAEIMRFNRVNHFLFQRAAVFSNAKSPVCAMTTGTAAIWASSEGPDAASTGRQISYHLPARHGRYPY